MSNASLSVPDLLGSQACFKQVLTISGPGSSERAIAGSLASATAHASVSGRIPSACSSPRRRHTEDSVRGFVLVVI
jgi:hypothetical protein